MRFLLLAYSFSCFNSPHERAYRNTGVTISHSANCSMITMTHNPPRDDVGGMHGSRDASMRAVERRASCVLLTSPLAI